jgi:hypothetical protein
VASPPVQPGNPNAGKQQRGRGVGRHPSPAVLSLEDPVEEDMEDAGPVLDPREREASESAIEPASSSSSGDEALRSRGKKSPRRKKRAPAASGVDDPIDDSQDDGSGPKGDPDQIMTLDWSSYGCSYFCY